MAEVCSILGSGNAAWHFTRLLLNAGHKIADVYIRNEEKDADFACFGEINKVRFLEDISQNSDFYFFCVSDDAITQLSQSFPFRLNERQISIHTSGMAPASVFEPFSTRFGCIWPLQTLKKGVVPLYEDFPLMLTASDSETHDRLSHLLGTFFQKSVIITDEQKSALHLAAVITGNFINHLLTTGFDYCHTQHLDFKLLRSLIMETLEKSLQSNDPSLIQTGPASRHDLKTMERHMDLLSNHKMLQDIYRTLSESIMTKHPRK
jgi:predicted short-subunit dehydrogenase-like oxidoreductase (DUF2520 family)